MNYVSVEGLSKSHGEKALFKDCYFGLSKGDKVALVANNGAGKSTLLKIIAGKETPDAGKVSIREGIRVGFLNQEPDFSQHETIAHLINGSNSVLLSVIQEYENALAAQGESYTDETHKRFELAAAAMDQYQAWDYERRLTTILSKFAIRNLDQPIAALSGGQKKRLALALVLLDNPELIVLDEPTNHLDLDMIEWLEEYLAQGTLTLLMVTHDRYFLDRVCNTIFELTNGRLYKHEGNYAYFLQKQAEREEVLDVEAGKAKQLMKKELEWMRRMPKARGTKSKARIDSFYDIQAKANSRKKQQELKLEVRMNRMGGTILELHKTALAFGDVTILQPFSYTFKKGERIGIIGKNGVGKTSFLNLITQKIQPDSGKLKVGDTIVYGYYTQSGIQLPTDKRVIEVVKDIAEVIMLSDGTALPASQFLTHFLFPPEMQYTFVSKLSGGERRRLHLLTILIQNPNFLILDEPTNDLDLVTLTKLEAFLAQFGGCLIVVSHDRYFMDKLVDHLFVFEGNGVIKDYNGTYSEYREEQDEIESPTEEPVAAPLVKEVQAASEPTTNGKKKLTFNEKREYEQLEVHIAALETEKSELEIQLSDTNADYALIANRAARYEEVKRLLDNHGLRWLELAERMD